MKAPSARQFSISSLEFPSQNLGWVDLGGELIEVCAHLRKFALVLILTRAGLEMDPEAFKKVYGKVLKLGLVPWIIECAAMAVMSHYFLSLPWLMAWALGAIFAAVSPAVVVPCLYRLRTKGYGVAKGIPTLIVAIAGIDDAASVAIFGILSSLIFGTGGLYYQISQAPVCIIGGLGFGLIWGFLSKFVPEKGDAYVIPIRTLMLFAGGLLAVYGSEEIGFEGAGPLGVVFAAFCSNYFWCQQGWEIEDNPVGTAFEIFWMFFEPILFGITGAAIKINELDPHIVTIGTGILLCAVVLRLVVTFMIACGDGLNMKEKVCVQLPSTSLAFSFHCLPFTLLVPGICCICVYGKSNGSGRPGTGCVPAIECESRINTRTDTMCRNYANDLHYEYCCDGTHWSHHYIAVWSKVADKNESVAIDRRYVIFIYYYYLLKQNT